MAFDPFSLNPFQPTISIYSGLFGKKKNRGPSPEEQRLALLKNLKKDDTIDEVTRQEILQLTASPITRGAGSSLIGSLTPLGVAGGTMDLAKAAKLFKGAREGVEPKFKARQVTQKLFETFVDQPGAAQLRGQAAFGSLLRK